LCISKVRWNWTEEVSHAGHICRPNWNVIRKIVAGWLKPVPIFRLSWLVIGVWSERWGLGHTQKEGCQTFGNHHIFHLQGEWICGLSRGPYTNLVVGCVADESRLFGGINTLVGGL
jgi:hypothetical protein